MTSKVVKIPSKRMKLKPALSPPVVNSEVSVKTDGAHKETRDRKKSKAAKPALTKRNPDKGRLKVVAADNKAKSQKGPVNKGEEKPPATEVAKKKFSHAFKRSWTVNDQKLLQLQSTFPGYEFEFTNQELHHHPIGATERAICEEIAYRDLCLGRTKPGKPQITDIGGNAKRHHDAGRKTVHSCCPVLTPQDVLRNERYTSKMNFCEEKSQECTMVPDAYLSVHSLYYLTRIEILELVHRCVDGRLNAVVHSFPDVYGHLHKSKDNSGLIVSESTYQVLSPDVVVMKANGNDGEYKHNPLLWLTNKYFQVGFKAMAWEGRKYGDTFIYKFRRAKPDLQVVDSTPLTLVESVSRKDFCSERKVQAVPDDKTFTPVLKFLSISKSKYKCFGPFVWVHGTFSSRSVMVPKNLISLVAYDMVGKQRHKESFAECIKFTKTHIRKYDLPDEIKVSMLIYAAALGFVLFLEEEITTFNKILTPRYQRMFGSLSRVLSLERIFEWSVPSLVGALTCHCSGEADLVERECEVRNNYDFTRTALYSTGVVSMAKAFPLGLPNSNSQYPTPAQKPGSSVKVVSESRKDYDAIRKDGVVHCQGVGFNGHMPVVTSANQLNEIVAIKTRSNAVVLPTTSRAWRGVNKAGDEYLDFDDLDLLPLEDAYLKWNAAITDSKRRKAHELAWASLLELPYQSKDDIRKLFVKIEKLMKSFPEGMKEFKPRLISACQDRCNVSLGPFATQYSNHLKQIWGIDNTITYGCGLTASSLGYWFEKHHRVNSRYITIDLEMCDGSLSEHGLKFKSRQYTRAGIAKYPNAVKAIKGLKKQVGYTPNGVKSTVKYTTPSGVAETTCGTSTLVGCMTLDAFIELEIIRLCNIIVLGDDTLTIYNPTGTGDLSDDQLKQGLEKHFAKLGYKAVILISDDPSGAEFCSGLFWPVVAKNGDGFKESFQHGPKIGRLLPKIGWNVKKLKPAQLKGMMIGYASMAYHIPVLRVYIDHVLELLEGVEAVTYEDKDFSYKVRAAIKHEVCDRTGEFFSARYGFPYSDAESQLRLALKDAKLGDSIAFPLLESIVEIDS